MDSPIIIVMDDNPDVRCVLHETLQERGYSVMTAPNGALGLEMALREQPDLLIVDMMMPQQSGFQVLKQFRAARGHSTPVLMISGNSDDRHQAYADILGANVFLPKPFGLNQLVDTVEQLCPLPNSSWPTSLSVNASVH